MSGALLTNTLDSEAEQVDASRPGTTNVVDGSGYVSVTQADTPGVDMADLPVIETGYLPDPTIGGEFGSGNRNGATDGLVYARSRSVAPMNGVVASLPRVHNTRIGEVGTTTHGNWLYAGVRTQADGAQSLHTDNNSAAFLIGTVARSRVTGAN